MTVLAAFAADSPTPSATGERVTTVVRADVRTGRLVRSVVVNAHPVAAPKAVEPVVVAPRVIEPVVPGAQPEPLRVPAAGSLADAVERIATDQQLPPALIHSVIKIESNYNPKAVSPKGAQGLMQLIPATARRFGVADAFDPVDNIQGGARYLKYLLDQNGGDYALALAAYNAGEGAVAKYSGIPPYPETRNYVKAVAGELRKNTAASQSKPGKPAATAPFSRGSGVNSSPAPGGGTKSTRIVEIHEADGSVRYVSQ